LENAVVPEKSLEAYKRMFADARDLLAENRREQQIDDDYYHGYQLTADERRILKKRGQPDTTFNRYKKAINGTLGVLESGQTDPRAYGRNPGVDEDAADVATKTLRFAADLNDFPDLRLACGYDYLVPGVCAVLVEVDDDRRPKLTQIHWEEFFYDPRSRKRDFSDARYMGIAKWMYADDVAEMYPDKKTEIEAAIETGPIAFDDTFQDRPQDSLSNWIDRRKRRLMVVEIYHREGQGWMRCVFHAAAVLEAGPSPYLDEKKRPGCAIVAQACYVDRENNRMGVGRDMRAPQDEFSKRRQKLLHLLNNRQMQAQPNEMGQMSLAADVDLVRTEAARPDGVIPPGWQPVPLTDLTAGQFNLLTLAESELDRQGPNPAILGRQGMDASGRAQQIRQEAGLTEDAVVYKGLHSWEVRTYRAMWNRCRQFWTAPDYIRVTDDEGAAKFIGINQPQPGPPQVVQHPETGMPMIQPTIMGYQNALAELDVDIMLDVVPDTATLAAEEFQTLSELAKVYGPQEVPFDDLLELSSIPDKRKLIEKRKARAGQQNPMQDLAMQGQVQTIRLTSAEADLATAKAQEIMGGGQQPEAPDPLVPYQAQTETAKARELHARADLTDAKTRTELLKPHMDVAQMAMDHEAAMQPAAGAQ
jgi:hypothetical protein